MRTRTFFFGLFILLCGLSYILASSSGLMSKDKADDAKKKQWAISAHAGSMDTPEEKERMNKTGCAHCHTAQGYWEVILAGKDSTAPYKNPSPNRIQKQLDLLRSRL